MSTEDFITKNNNDWKQIHKEIFGIAIPNHFEWTNIDDIIKVLNIIGSFPNSNHMFFPDGGGLDLQGASNSKEKNAIELLTGISYIVKPKKLVFEHIDNDFEWNYFRLETGDLKATGVYESYSDDFQQEELVELSPNHYIKRHYWDVGIYNDEPLPTTARLIVRFFKGSFVIFKKSSIYNANSGTYDGRHEKLGEEGFKKHIKDACDYVNKNK